MKLRFKKKLWQEKRDSVRFPIECPVQIRQGLPKKIIWFTKKEPEESLPALMQNPSLYGMRILAESPLPEDLPLRISVPLSSLRAHHPDCQLLGDIVWAKKNPAVPGHSHGIRLSNSCKDFPKWQAFIMELLESDERQEKVDFL